MHPSSCTSTHHDVTDMVNPGTVNQPSTNTQDKE